MFDVTPDDIAQLNDTDLRELVGRLCEAELAIRGLSPAAVTWGGSQTAPDGGLDTRVELPPGTDIDGFIPRRITGFQAKKTDMPRSAILAEMRPGDVVRPVIQELADEAGAYVIVSSAGSTADVALRNRREAMREALGEISTGEQLHTDFFDRTRMATWVRRHPGLVTWVKEKVGRAVSGWRPYGPWSNGAENVDAKYLLDDTLRLDLGSSRRTHPQPVADAIDTLRDELAQPRKIVRLVGLSGVGKTRFAQALFDSRVGARSLPPSWAVYTNLSDNPNPQPTGLASDLIANCSRAILIVDNCPPDLHHRLSELCRRETSTVSVLTIEYDVRDDQPEGTQVVTLDTSSVELIEGLVRRRYPHLSQVDARTIAEASGGNARVAIVLAETVGRSESIGGLSNDELFQRIFRQRNEPDDALYRAAQACSLVYSFQGEALEGEAAELPRLAALAGQAPAEVYRHVRELVRRGLVQQRGVWRAVLPHAIANRLAARALEDTPYDLVNQQLVEGGTARLARSFSRRLMFLNDHPQAITIVERWLAPGGLLGDVAALGDLGRAMFENVAPVLPLAALRALERVGTHAQKDAVAVWMRHLALLRSIAYDPELFGGSAQLLMRAALESGDEQQGKASEIFVSLFTIYLSGTHATIEQRLSVVEQLLRSPGGKSRSLGIAALGAVLETTHFSSGHLFEFGAHSRDYGSEPKTIEDVVRWYSAALGLIKKLVRDENMLQWELRDLLAQKFQGLWSSGYTLDELENLFRNFAEEGFWRAGWVACRETIYFDRGAMPPEALARLSALEAELQPSSLSEQVRAVVLGDFSDGLDLTDSEVDGDPTSGFERLEAIARDLGAAVASDVAVLGELLPDLLRGGIRVWAFARGLAEACMDRRATWERLVDCLSQTPPGQQNVQVLRGFLAELWERDRDLAQDILDSVLDYPDLVAFLPDLHSAVWLDERGVERLRLALSSGQLPARNCWVLASRRTTDHLAGRQLKKLLLLIADHPGGYYAAFEILYMRFLSGCSAQREHDPSLQEAGRELIRRIVFDKDQQQHRDRKLGKVAKGCLAGPAAASVAAEIAGRLKQAVAAYETYAFHNRNLLEGLLELQPGPVLDKLFAGDEDSQRAGQRVFTQSSLHRPSPANVIPSEALVAWCERDPRRRYPLAASIITFAYRSNETGILDWSEQAKALLIHSHDPEAVLAVFIKRFRPMSWSGSRAAIFEANAQLLDLLEPVIPSELMRFVAATKTRIAKEVENERQQETERDRDRDERFE